MELTYKDRLVIKSNERISRLMTDRMPMTRNSPQWHTKTRLIGQEKEFIKGLRAGSVTIDQHPEVRAVN